MSNDIALQITFDKENFDPQTNEFTAALHLNSLSQQRRPLRDITTDYVDKPKILKPMALFHNKGNQLNSVRKIR